MIAPIFQPVQWVERVQWGFSARHVTAGVIISVISLQKIICKISGEQITHTVTSYVDCWRNSFDENWELRILSQMLTEGRNMMGRIFLLTILPLLSRSHKLGMSLVSVFSHQILNQIFKEKTWIKSSFRKHPNLKNWFQQQILESIFMYWLMIHFQF